MKKTAFLLLASCSLAANAFTLSKTHVGKVGNTMYRATNSEDESFAGDWKGSCQNVIVSLKVKQKQDLLTWDMYQNKNLLISDTYKLKKLTSESNSSSISSSQEVKYAEITGNSLNIYSSKVKLIHNGETTSWSTMSTDISVVKDGDTLTITNNSDDVDPVCELHRVG